MSAAPLVSNSHFEDECAFSNPAKRLRRSDMSGLESGESMVFEPSISTTSATFGHNLEILRSRFPSVNEGILSSILESTGDKLNVATGLLVQLVNMRPTRTCRTKRPRAALPSEGYDLESSNYGDVRRMPAESESDAGGSRRGAKCATGLTSGLQREYLQHSVSQILMRLRGVKSESEAFSRLQPILSEVIQNNPELIQTKALQKVLTKAIVRQVERIQVLSDCASRNNREAQQWREKAMELEAVNAELLRANRGLKDANNVLSFYIKSTTQPSIYGGSSFDGPPNPFEGGFRGPDVC
eukprot:Gregarina_sp_Poly_1__10318@NODE_72_length_15994_cov_120_491179_g62_i0_p4_GENE_NODE_72_length_15994_cov_120_491179_g62_i0NODE_72_length_15994_cov_120_491179_g62_i0_p4_ORF_typecomplete_len298_score33_83JAKMIP_CC3/PF16034_5/0_15XPCbinding/PF09280_11/0_36_NODE_72_length_15994_cov_120_491179_g62_i01180112694